jgi:hypothetical protein
MPKFDLTEEERHALADLARQKICEDRFPMSPRLAPLKSALAKLDPGSVPKSRQELPPLPTGPMVGSRRKARR